jgi:DNA mismatch repair protein MutS
MEKTTQPLARALKEFVSINSRMLTHLHGDFLFYLGALKLFDALKRCGLPVARPKVLDREKRRFEARDIYNVDLALHLMKQRVGKPENLAEEIVTNDFAQDQGGRIIIITGANRGGKTTLLQAIGLAQIMMQVGLYVHAREAAVSVCDNILTHYPALEKMEKGRGRFGEEALRIGSVFESATRHSLLLLNESLSSTSRGESLYLAQDIVRVLQMLGARAGEGNAGSAEKPWKIKPTFKTVPGPPEDHSYAIDLARRYGIGREQLIETLEQRGGLTASS